MIYLTYVICHLGPTGLRYVLLVVSYVLALFIIVLLI